MKTESGRDGYLLRDSTTPLHSRWLNEPVPVRSAAWVSQDVQVIGKFG